MRSMRGGGRKDASTQRGGGAVRSARRSATPLVTTTVLVAMLAVACGSSSSGGAGSAAKPKLGAPLKLLVMYQFAGDPIAEHPEVGAGAESAAAAINAAGGINGHEVVIVTCDIRDNPAQEQACAQKAISEKVTAVVGSLFESGAQSIPALQQAGIPIIGNLGVYTPAEFSNPDVWPLMGGASTTYPAIPHLVAKQGLKRLAVVQFSGQGAGLTSLIQAQTKQAGMTYAGTVNVPLTASDYSTYVQALKGMHPDVVVQVLSTTGSVQIMKAGQQLGLHAAWANQTLNIDVSNLATFGALANGMYITSSFPPATATADFPGIAKFNSEMDAGAKAGVKDTDARTAQAITSWVAVHAVAEVAKATTGLLTSAALTQALKSAQSVDVEGLINWSPNATGPANFTRITNSDVYLEKVDAGKLTLVSNTPVDYFKAAGMTP